MAAQPVLELVPEEPIYQAYIFVRPGMIPEQIGIQVGHVCMKAGLVFKDHEGMNPDKLHYCMVPMLNKDDEATAAMLESLGIAYTSFEDHEYYFEGEKLVESEGVVVTAIMTEPLQKDSVPILKLFPLLRCRISNPRPKVSFE